jgi:hypothetical protein
MGLFTYLLVALCLAVCVAVTGFAFNAMLELFGAT